VRLFATGSSGTGVHGRSRLPADQTALMLLFLLYYEVAESVDIAAKAIRQLAPHGTYFSDHWVLRFRIHGVRSSSGVQTIGGSKPSSRQTAFTIFNTTAFAI
jgi:hypothetical protein